MKPPLLYQLSIAAVMSTAPAASGPAHLATVRGALVATLGGSAQFGPTQGGGSPASFSLELGTNSDNGAVVLSRVGAERPQVGTYMVTPLGAGAEGTDEFHVLVALGSAERPVGVFHAVGGTVTISQSSEGRMVGRYEVRAVGFLAANLDDENREITVRGSFSAQPSSPLSGFSATVDGALRLTPHGSAEFGEVAGARDRTFTLTMGAYSEQGAIVLSRAGGGRPGVGIYDVQEDGSGSEFHGLVVTGAPSHPTGVFRVSRGTLTITSSTPERITGIFEMHAIGFLAETIDIENREANTSGRFSATATGQPSNLPRR